MAKNNPPIIIIYTNLLHKTRDPQSPMCVAFKNAHASDEVFTRRAEVLDKVWLLKKMHED